MRENQFHLKLQINTNNYLRGNMKSFSQFMNEMFAHPGDVPIPLAMSIYKVMHNQATADDWEQFDKLPREEVLIAVKEILKMNNVPNIKDELDWWEEQLARPDN